MFALVLFSDNVYYICKKANIIEGRGSCSIKYKDGKRYAGKIIACKEDYKELVTLKLKLENESNIENRKQLTYNRNIYKRKLQNALLENKENLCTKNTDLKTVKKKIIKKKHIIAQDRHDRDELDINKDVSKVVEDGINGNIPEASNNIGTNTTITKLDHVY
ncbi:uncharacterized protein [Temnothorax nylanderi]|uniref:uncharacterized protein n=1 Tax=Temnothorax nylanderi TaxID=102681 RepID=UPI003A892ADE